MSRFDDILTALRRADQLSEAPDSSVEIGGITEDSRRVQPGWLFCAVEGSADDGHRYVADAVDRGAAAVLVTRRVDAPVPQLVVRQSRVGTALAAAAWYGHPGDAMECIAVTGTNGKSTTVAIIRHLLNGEGDAGYVGTLGAFDGRDRALYQEGLTTPGSIQLQGTLALLREAGVRSVAMEVSSHALDQDRVTGLTFAAAVFTNLTHDHLDYHASFDAYVAAKCRLATYVRADGALVVNADEPQWSALPATAPRTSFAVHAEADVRASEVDLGPDGTRFQLRCGSESVAVRMPLLGRFNVSNAVAAAAAAWRLGHSPEAIAARLADVPPVPGRMERLPGDEVLILRDYAHTPDALQRALRAARALTTGRLVVVFGCGGDRDRAKRPAMGQIAVAEADIAIVTSDNPRTEDPDRIIDDIVAGIDGRAFVRITDRREAIARAVGLIEPGDTLMLAGKGHETYQVLGHERVPFDERAIVREALAARAAS